MKKLIYAITPNPALDLGGVVENLKPNEKSYVSDETRAPGGNSVNAARILDRLGIPVTLSGFLGGSTGEEVSSLIKKENLKTEFVRIQSPTRINVTVSNKFDHYQTRLSFPGPIITNSEKQKLFSLFEKKSHISFLLFGGSLPNGFTPKDIIRLIKISDSKGIKTFIDCPGSILAQVISAKPFLIKPNLVEFQELTNSKAKTIGAVLEKAKKLLDRTPYICISSVEDGALLVSRKNSYFGRIPKIEIQSTVGAGDSMVGAMASQFYKNDLSEGSILKWGLAAAAATLAERGTALGSLTEMNRFYQKTTVKKIGS